MTQGMETLDSDSGVVSSGPRPALVVGIGASAGGLESLEKLFGNLPSDTRMAFVVLQHLSPDFKSMMDELLARDTRMPVHLATDGMVVEANHVYLLPPRKEMIIADGRLHLADKDPHQGLALPIDHFFESLAREYQAQAVGIILSGSGSDGTRGAMEISRQGGLVISESADSAKFDSMPVSAQASGAVDLVLGAEQIGPTLARYAVAPSSFKQVSVGRPRKDPSQLPLTGIDAIFELFRDLHQIDFSGYRQSTMLRRINRRLALNGLTALDEYVERLSGDAQEQVALLEDLLIGVTQFFRDSEAFDHLTTQVLPDLIRRCQPERTFRAWVAGCATGEEAYTLAIALTEAFERVSRPPRFKLFATDLHKASLQHAGRGVYSGEALSGLSPQRLQRFFVPCGDGYRVTPELRKGIVFAPHNVLCDAPFTDLDLVSCRNLLIYFRPAAQQRALTMLHDALRVGGVLFLGGSETPGELSAEFEVVQERLRVFRKRRDVRLGSQLRASSIGPEPLRLGSNGRHPKAPLRAAAVEMQAVYNQLLARYMPPSLLVDQQRQLLDSFGGAEQLLRLPPRGPSLDVLDLVDRQHRTTLSGALVKAAKEGAPVRYANFALQVDSARRGDVMTVIPLASTAAQSYFLITFEPSTGSIAPSKERVVEGDDSPGERIEELEDELRYSKENLQATIEELETSNEELQATNEELIASNEELQSTNEELHSVNEELYSVNSEHQLKIAELAELNRDMNHLLENTDVAIIYLDDQLRVRRFTSGASKLYDLVEHDIGRPLVNFSPRIEIPNLQQRLLQVLGTGQASEWDIRCSRGAAFLLRLLPYRSGPGPQGVPAQDGAPPAEAALAAGDSDPVEGVVLMLVDVSSLEEMRGRLRWMSAIVESTDDAIIGEDTQGRITSWNHGAERLYQYTAQEALGQPISMLVPPDRRGELREYSQRVDRGEPVSLDTVRLRKDGQPVDVSLTISPVYDDRGQVIGVSKIARDIRPRIEMEEQMRRQARLREQFLAMLSHELRNPLGALLTASHLMQHTQADAQVRDQAAETARRQVTMMQSLLDDLLDISRISLGKISLHRQRVDLRELVETVRETTGAVIDKHHDRLVIEVSDEPLPVDGDPARLVQIQVNLIHNAAKYSPSNSQITVRLDRLGDQAVIRVTDQGAGIAPEFLPKLFEPFTQSDATATRSDGGLGVGLALVKELVQMHGGRVEVAETVLGQGSTFAVYLPLDEQPARADPPPTAAPPQLVQTRPLRVVLIEDRAENRRLLRMLLELDEHRVGEFGSGEEGLEAILEDPPEIALIDIGLPGIDGIEVAKRVRKQIPPETTALVALTGFGQPDDVRRASEAGFDAHLVKPVSPEQLEQVIAALVDQLSSAEHRRTGSDR